MKKKFISYIEADFLKDFVALRNTFDIEDEGNQMDVWRRFLSFYKNKTVMGVEGLNSSFAEKENSLIKHLLNRYSVSDESVFVVKKESWNSIKNLDFAFCNDTTQKSVADIKGINLLCAANILQEGAKFFTPNTQRIPGANQGKFAGKGWEGIKIPRHPCNAIIISDNYLLGNKQNLVNNLYSLFEKIIPATIGVELDITLFSYQFYPCYDPVQKKHANPTISDLKIVQEDIIRLLDVELNISRVNFTVVAYQFSKDFHDRFIFTNSFVFKSGNSFSYFGPNGKPILPSDTSFDTLPLPADNDPEYYAETYSPTVQNLEKIMNESHVFCGSKRNRLFDFFNR